MARDTSELESESVDVDSVQVPSTGVNPTIAARLPSDPADARKRAFIEGYDDEGSEDGENDGDGEVEWGLLSSPDCRDEDDREFPLHVHDDGLPEYDDVAYVKSVASDEDESSLYGVVVRVDDVGQWGDQDLYLAGSDGTTIVRIQADHSPSMRAGDQVVLGDVERNDDEDGGAAWKQTPESSIVVIDNSTYPAGYLLEERSGLVQAESWYADDDTPDWKAEMFVKNTILDECHIETPRGQDDDMWMYVDDPGSDLHGTWTSNGEDRIKELLDEHLPEWKTNDRTKNSIVSSLIDQTRVPDDEWDEGTPEDEALQWAIGVQNGVIDLSTGELHDHGPEWRIRRKLPVEYKPEQYDDLGDGIQWFIDATMKTDGDRESFKYLLGHALARCYPAETVWALIGPGGNGKTLLLEVIQQLLGDVSGAFDLDIMTSDSSFGGGPLIGSNLAIDDDATDVKMQKTGLMKKASGGSEAMINTKYDQMTGDGYNNFATMVYLANDPPMFGDKTRGMERRIFPIMMPFEFTDDPSDDKKDKIPRREIRDRTQTTDELEALLVVAVEYARKLYRGDDVSDGRTEDERWTTYEKYSDNILRFWMECTNASQGTRVTRNAVYEIYVQWCNHRGVDPKPSGGRNGFWPLSDQCHGVSYNRDSVYLDGERAIEHVTLDPDALDYAPEWVSEKWEADIDDDETTLANRLDRPTPLADLDGGYCTTEARVIARGHADESEEVGVQLTLEDDTTAIDAITWGDEFDGVHVGDKVRLDRAKLSQYRGVPQLKTAGPTDVRVVEEGPNARREDYGSDSNSESESESDTRNAALEETIDGDGEADDSDDGESETLKDVVADVESEHDDEEGAPIDAVRDEAADRGMADDELHDAFERLQLKGELYEPVDGRWRCT